MNTHAEILKKTENHIRSTFEKEPTGHDWWHIYRVRRMALKIASEEGGDTFIIEMAALLHDLDDWKFNAKGASKTKTWLMECPLSDKQRTWIREITEQVSFKGNTGDRTTSLEARIVQDADRLDAIGAIGIARTFAYGGNKNRLIHHPDIKPVIHKNFDSYKNSQAPTINHFYEKLLLLKDLLHTSSALSIAQKRHAFMESYLQQFLNEWEGIE